MGMRVIFQAVERAGSIKPMDMAKVLSGTTFHTLYGRSPMREEDHQMVGPNFSAISANKGKLRPIITRTIPAATIVIDRLPDRAPAIWAACKRCRWRPPVAAASRA